MPIDEFVFCTFGRSADNPKKIVVVEGNDHMKPGDTVGTMKDEDVAWELCHLWNEGMLRMEADYEEEPEEEEVEETTLDIESFLDDIRFTLDGPEGTPTLDTLKLVTSRIKDREGAMKEIKESMCGGEVDINGLYEIGIEPVEIHEHIAELRERAEEEAERQNQEVKKLIRETVVDAIDDNILVIKLMVSGFEDHLKLLDQLTGKLGDEDMQLRKILAHVRNQIVIKNSSKQTE